jgi:hypothetical protein
MKKLSIRRCLAFGLCFAAAFVRAETPAPDKPASAAKAVDPAPTDIPDYVRLTGDEKSNRLEVKVSTFNLPDGRVVDLFGVVHLGDATYYQEVGRRLAGYDAVLFELVGNPEGLQKPGTPSADPPARPHPLRGLQKGIGNLFKLDFQLEQIDYTKPNFVHADASAEEFSQMQAERGESMMKLLLRSMQMSGDPALQEKFKEAESIGLGDLVMLFYSEKSMQRIKLVFARLLADSEELLEGKMFGENNAIIHGRNEVALKKLKEVLADPAKKRVSIFYGAGHMPSMERDLKEDWKATLTGETWLPAWTMPAKAKRNP